MTVYVDVLFGVNAIMDYAVLLSAARFAGLYPSRLRMVLGACLGGIYAVLALAAPILAILPVRLAVGVLLCLAAYGRRENFARVCLLFFVMSAAFAGIATALGAATGRRLLLGAGYYFAVPARVLLLAGAAGYGLSAFLLRGDAAHGAVRREIERVSVCVAGQEALVSVLRDTGNDLREPVSGRAVLILGVNAARRVLPAMQETLLKLPAQGAAACLQQLPEGIKPRCGLLPYHAVGTAGGLLLYIRPDSARRQDGKRIDCVVAVSPNELAGDGYEGLLGV